MAHIRGGHVATADRRRVVFCAAPAKLNLFFEVFGRRSDCFHEIVSLASPVTLSDTVTMEATESPAIHLTVEGVTADSAEVPADERNLVVRALKLLQVETGTNRGAQVALFKRIPSQAGLGGGSSDAATALRLADRAW